MILKYTCNEKRRLPPTSSDDQSENFSIGAISSQLITKTDNDTVNEKYAKFPKRKVALFLGYNGSGYYGMQYNKDLPTIEKELFEAMCKAGAVSNQNSDDITKIGFMRACRTDKGVHAAAQLVSCKMIIEDEKIVEKIQQNLSCKNIVLYGYQRVAGSFHAKNYCDSRIYEYLFPTYILKSFDDQSYVERTFVKSDKPVKDSTEKENAGDDSSDESVSQKPIDIGSNTADTNSIFEKGTKISSNQKKSLISYRITGQELEKLRRLLSKYEGTKNFHNFTSGKSPSEPAAKRHIKYFIASDPFVVAHGSGDDCENGMEWISLKVHGSSFMLHQIRKMVGLVFLMIKFGSDEQLIDWALSTTMKINIPKAPSLGLLLDRCFFDIYNKSWKFSDKEKVSFDSFDEEIKRVKESLIYSKMFQIEQNEFEFIQWIECIQRRPYEFYYLNTSMYRPTFPLFAANLNNNKHNRIESGNDNDE